MMDPPAVPILPTSAEEVLVDTMETLESYLTDLQELENAGECTEWMRSAKTAYVACLELLVRWSGAASHGFGYDIEETFPVK